MQCRCGITSDAEGQQLDHVRSMLKQQFSDWLKEPFPGVFGLPTTFALGMIERLGDANPGVTILAEDDVRSGDDSYGQAIWLPEGDLLDCVIFCQPDFDEHGNLPDQRPLFDLGELSSVLDGEYASQQLSSRLEFVARARPQAMRERQLRIEEASRQERQQDAGNTGVG